MEEVTQCSQGSTFVGSQSTSDMGSGLLLIRDECTLAEECNVTDPGCCSISCSESHPIDTHGVGGLTFNEMGSTNDWDSSVVNNWQISPEELSNMLSQDLGQFMQHLNGNNSQHIRPSPLQHSITNMVAGCFPSNRDMCGVEQSVDPILQHSNYPVAEESTFTSHSCYSLGSADMFSTLYAQEPSVPVEHHFTVVNEFSEENQEQDSVPDIYDGLIHINDSSNSPCGQPIGQMQQEDDPPMVVDIDHSGSALSHNVQTSVGKDPVVQEDHRDSGNLYYEPPHFPFLCCDLIQSGSDTLQEFSPLGTRQFWTSVNRFWDSPSGERSPDAVLKSAAKSYLCTPSILKKRNRDLVSPLSEKRLEKKFERDLNQEEFSKLSSEFSRLDVMLDEIDKSSKDIERTVDIIEDKENRAPDTGQGERKDVKCIKGTTSADARLPLTEVVADINKNDGEGTDADSDGRSKNYAINCKEGDANCNKDVDRDNNASAEIASGLDHDINSCLLFSPERFGIKRLEAATVVTSMSEATSTSMISPGMSKMKDDCNLVMSEVPPSSSSFMRDGDKTGHSEITCMFGETPIRRNFESPSAWKSPWFISPFLLGSRVDTDISIEDYGLFVSPKDKTFDAIGLMKQLSEQTAPAFANAQQVLGDETPETILRKKFSSKLKQDRENNERENCELEQQPSQPSTSVPSERRVLDFSNCGTPEKEPSKNGKISNAMFCSPPSCLLKNCR
ncbi:hypothetical protein Leryth_016294 [Lithospermum erythrorhizon]|nr:hypothetical protein Leryth_016294 [Lithospermum erythrorhizon]